VNVGVTNNGDIFGGTQVSFGDVLGDKQVNFFAASISQYRTLSLSYVDLSRRFQWALQGYSQTQFFYGQVGGYFYDPYDRPYYVQLPTRIFINTRDRRPRYNPTPQPTNPPNIRPFPTPQPTPPPVRRYPTPQPTYPPRYPQSSPTPHATLPPCPPANYTANFPCRPVQQPTPVPTPPPTPPPTPKPTLAPTPAPTAVRPHHPMQRRSRSNPVRRSFRS